jgi:hypothetical protein
MKALFKVPKADIVQRGKRKKQRKAASLLKTKCSDWNWKGTCDFAALDGTWRGGWSLPVRSEYVKRRPATWDVATFERSGSVTLESPFLRLLQRKTYSPTSRNK